MQLTMILSSTWGSLGMNKDPFLHSDNCHQSQSGQNFFPFSLNVKNTSACSEYIEVPLLNLDGIDCSKWSNYHDYTCFYGNPRVQFLISYFSTSSALLIVLMQDKKWLLAFPTSRQLAFNSSIAVSLCVGHSSVNTETPTHLRGNTGGLHPLDVMYSLFQSTWIHTIKVRKIQSI